MTTWRYFDDLGYRRDPRAARYVIAPIEQVGARELELLLIARRSSSGTLVLSHIRERNAERMAARRLVERGLLRAPNGMGSERTGWLYFYGLTERGRTAWLRCRS